MIIIYITLFTLIFFRINQVINKGKRFQESNKIEQIWRYRFYLPIPFMWLWYTIKGFKVYKDEWVDDKIIHTDEYYLIKGKTLWKTLKGIRQGNMEWYYTSEEVFDKIKKRV